MSVSLSPGLSRSFEMWIGQLDDIPPVQSGRMVEVGSLDGWRWANVFVVLILPGLSRSFEMWIGQLDDVPPVRSGRMVELNVHQRSLGAAGLEICGAGGSVPQGQPSSAGSVGSAPSPASPRPTPQPRPPVASTTSQPSRTLDDDRSTDAVGTGTAAEDSDDGESIAQYVSTNCVVFTHYRGDAASEVEEHFQRALAHDKPKENISPMFMRNFPPSFWKSQHPGEVYECPTDPWHPHYPQYHHRAVHEYHHHNMATVTSYGGLLLGGARGLGHHAAHHAHSAASYKDWPSATPSQSFVDASSAPSYPHGYYAPLSELSTRRSHDAFPTSTSNVTGRSDCENENGAAVFATFGRVQSKTAGAKCFTAVRWLFVVDGG
ncbi:Protein vestigial [Melipona quadrifasciata]|uniref:Protein vestigial n=1 Tax=Melipona quadrifasciata TaxID=166423 RepID=A0A0M9A259_9HYME|nr:Protein vestigial [Melipona quadrifasciata]